MLRQSMTINRELIGYIKQIHVLGELSDFSESIIEELQNLADLLADLDTFYIGDYKIRQLIDLTRLKLRSVVVDELPIEATPKSKSCLLEKIHTYQTFTSSTSPR